MTGAQRAARRTISFPWPRAELSQRRCWSSINLGPVAESHQGSARNDGNRASPHSALSERLSRREEPHRNREARQNAIAQNRPRSVRKISSSGVNLPSPHRTKPGMKPTTSKNGNQLISSNSTSSTLASPQRHEQPSLVEQLFPEESKRYVAQQKLSREVPRLPLDLAPTPTPVTRQRRDEEDETRVRPAARKLQREMENAEIEDCILCLRNAGTHLVEEDFRRMIPQGKHIEGWTLEQGDIVKIIPGRDLETLAQLDFYYLVFSSPISAFTYQGHVTRVHKLAAINVPSSVTSVMPPPPGYMIEGLDVHAALQAYALVPPSQHLELRQLRRPLSPLLRSIIQSGGYPAIVDREGRMPFEVRLTLNGPQLSASTIRHALVESGRSRALGWAGGESDNYGINVHKWEVSTREGSSRDANRDSDFAETLLRDSLQQSDLEQSDPSASSPQYRRRTAQSVYIIGFYSLESAQSFIAYWHCRPLTVTKKLTSSKTSSNESDEEDVEGDSPPIVNAELLW